LRAKPRYELTGEDTSLPADLWLPRLSSLELSARKLVEPVLQAEWEDLLEIVVWGLSLFGVGETSDGDTRKDGLARRLVSEDKCSWAVTDCRNGLSCQYKINFRS
jgi:hypothetical protein